MIGTNACWRYPEHLQLPSTQESKRGRGGALAALADRSTAPSACANTSSWQGSGGGSRRSTLGQPPSTRFEAPASVHVGKSVGQQDGTATHGEQCKEVVQPQRDRAVVHSQEVARMINSHMRCPDRAGERRARGTRDTPRSKPDQQTAEALLPTSEACTRVRGRSRSPLSSTTTIRRVR